MALKKHAKLVHKHTVQKRPAGTTAGVASLVVVIGNLLGLNLDATQAALLVGGLTSVVSALKPLVEKL